MGKFAVLFESIEYAYQKSKEAKASGRHFSKSLNDHMYMHRISSDAHREKIEQKISKHHGEEALKHTRELTKAMSSAGKDRDEKVEHHENAAHAASKTFRDKRKANESVESIDEAEDSQHSPVKSTFVIHVTRRGRTEPESYEADSFSPRKFKRHHDSEGDTLHKIVHKGTGKEVTNEATEVLDESSTWGGNTTLRKKGGYENGNRKATVHRDVDWNEYRVKHHVDGKHQKEADYHTDDSEDAHNHAKHWVSKANESVEEASMPQKRKFTIHVTPKGKDKPETYDSESYSPARYIRHHEGEGDTVHKIIDHKNGKDVSQEGRDVAKRSPLYHNFDESTDLDEAQQPPRGYYRSRSLVDHMEKLAHGTEDEKKQASRKIADNHGSDALKHANVWAKHAVLPDKHPKRDVHLMVDSYDSAHHASREFQAEKKAKSAISKASKSSKKNESVELDEGVPLKGHPYHSKTDAELHYIVKDAAEAARAMKDHDPKAEAKYLDQVNDASTVLHHRKSKNEATALEERDRSEFVANQALSGDKQSVTTQHHVYVTTRGKKKSIAGPFRSKEEAETHPARKFGDGVATSDQIQH
jgi:hypothetical protein